MQDTKEKFKKFKKTPLLVSAMFLLFSCAVFFVLFRGLNNNTETTLKSLTEWQNEAIRRNEIKSLDLLIKNIQEQKKLLESHFAESSNIVPFLDTIEQLASKVGAKSEVTSVDISKNKPELLVSFRASGSFESVYKFLRLLENSPYELEFSSVDMKNVRTSEAPEEKRVASLWEATFKIKLLSFIP